MKKKYPTANSNSVHYVTAKIFIKRVQCAFFKKIIILKNSCVIRCDMETMLFARAIDFTVLILSNLI